MPLGIRKHLNILITKKPLCYLRECPLNQHLGVEQVQWKEILALAQREDDVPACERIEHSSKLPISSHSRDTII